MSRHSPRAEMEFGNDSFLDVICNVVGILIILILVSGLHVSQAPLSAEILAKLAASIETEAPVPPKPQIAVVKPLPVPVELPPVKPPDIALSPELVKMRDKLRSEADVRVTAITAADAKLAELTLSNTELKALLAQTSESAASQRSEAEQRNQDVQSLVTTLEKAKRELSLLREEVQRAGDEGPPVKAIKHRMTPMSKLVQGNEVHFRLLENKVACVPVDELAERLRPQIERQKDLLMRFRRQEGQVGPVSGFSMRYAVERESMSPADEMRGGQGMMRISVTRWEIVPEPELQTETAAQALKRGSAFLRAVKMADVDATLTFWVYPDSFEVFRKLRDFAYEEGFSVAARPLPHGVPIAGSPGGSRSTGQ